MRIKQLLQQAKTDIDRLDAEILLAHIVQKDRGYLLAYDDQNLTPIQQKQFGALVQRRKQGEPVAYLTGHQEFWSLDLLVTPDVLIPRPETELLVEQVLAHLPENDALTIVDLGTGSGAIALALASERPHWHIIAVDYSSAALSIAQQNAQRLGMNNVEFVESDWCAQLPKQHYDAIVSNPPYIDARDPHLSGLQFEPQSALVAARQGLADIELIAGQAKQFLKAQGLLAVEHGYQQALAVKKLLTQQGYQQAETYQDLAGQARVCLVINQ